MGVMDTAAQIVQANDPDWAYVNGGESFSDGINNYFMAWFDTPNGDGRIIRRQIVCRLIVPLDVARQVRDQANKVWSRGGH